MLTIIYEGAFWILFICVFVWFVAYCALFKAKENPDMAKKVIFATEWVFAIILGVRCILTFWIKVHPFSLIVQGIILGIVARMLLAQKSRGE